MLAAQWQRISQEEAFVGRCGEVGDELGSAVVAARLVREIMRLCFLMERQYAPYSKWLGTAFSRLACGPALVPILRAVLRAATWQERERPLGVAYETIARMHNALGITAPLDPRTGHYHGRPFTEQEGALSPSSMPSVSPTRSDRPSRRYAARHRVLRRRH